MELIREMLGDPPGVWLKMNKGKGYVWATATPNGTWGDTETYETYEAQEGELLTVFVDTAGCSRLARLNVDLAAASRRAHAFTQLPDALAAIGAWRRGWLRLHAAQFGFEDWQIETAIKTSQNLGSPLSVELGNRLDPETGERRDTVELWAGGYLCASIWRAR